MNYYIKCSEMSTAGWHTYLQSLMVVSHRVVNGFFR